MMIDYDAGCNNFTDCTINSDFVMKKLEESPCLGRANFGVPQNSNYILPYPVGTSYPVYQSYCWSTGGHRNQLAYDFTMPIGDTVIASRRGVVREVKENSPDNGQGYGEHNYVYIQHDDGTLASYAHLKQYSVVVEPNDTVEVGQYIALSGNSGKSGEPHLHIGVYENYPPVEGVDIPINFRNAEGPLDSRGGLIRGENYKALPY
jgi:murein DD-endopeptidase MepM/ murein hydrolase activator NlpD